MVNRDRALRSKWLWRLVFMERIIELLKFFAGGDVGVFDSGSGVAGEEGELFGSDGDGFWDIFGRELVGFVGEAVGEGVERFLEVGDGV